MTNHHRKKPINELDQIWLRVRGSKSAARQVFNVALGRSVRTVFDNLQFGNFRAMTLILFDLAPGFSTAIGWLEQKVEYYAGIWI